MIDHTEGQERRERQGVEAWDLMADVWKSFKPWIEQVATSYGLSPQQLVSMKIIGEYGTMTMSELAGHLGCDASNVTSIVDKLQTRGYVERRSSEQDRRVKSLVMTAQGTDLYRAARERMHQPPPAISNLAVDDQEALCAILKRALTSIGQRLP